MIYSFPGISFQWLFSWDLYCMIPDVSSSLLCSPLLISSLPFPSFLSSLSLFVVFVSPRLLSFPVLLSSHCLLSFLSTFFLVSSNFLSLFFPLLFFFCLLVSSFPLPSFPPSCSLPLAADSEDSRGYQKVSECGTIKCTHTRTGL